MGKYYVKIVALSIFGAKPKIALTGVRSIVRESLAKMANLILLPVYFLLKLSNFLLKSAFRQFRKYISKIIIHSKLQEPTFKECVNF